MSDPQASASPATFTPSELVVLFGDRFAEEGGMLTAKEEVLTSGKKVSAEKLAHAAMAAALLAAEQSGAVRLEVRRTKALFGLMKGEKLHVVPGPRPSAWPAGTVEAAIAESAPSGPEASDLFGALIGAKTANASQRFVSVVKAGLAGRGLLGTEQKKTLMVFTTMHFTLPDATRAAAGRASTDPVRDLLRSAEQGRPHEWSLMMKAIRAAITWMTETSD
ncbi:MAG TPA: hypothetical protein VF746_31640 [Longimicrobium sp.]|jgi:hypothetical protein